MKLLVVVAILVAPSLCFGYDGKLFSLAVGAKLSNDLVRRGARLYDGVQAAPILYVGLLDDRIQFLGNSLEYADFFVGDQFRARTKLAQVSDRPFLKTSGPLTARNARESSFEWTSRIEAFFPSFNTHWFQADLAYSKDIKAHAGHYLELTGRVTLGRFLLENDKPKLQPQVFATLGWGDSKHNGYLYGAGANSSGFNHVAYGFMLVAPARTDPHYAVIQLYRYDVLGQSNRNGSLVSQRSGYHLDITVALGIF